MTATTRKNPVESPRRPWVSYRFATAAVMAGLVAASVLAVAHTNERQLRATLLAQSERQLLLEARNLALLSGDALLSEYPELTLVPLILEIERERPELTGVVVVDHANLIRGHADPRQVGRPWTAVSDSSGAQSRDFLDPDERLWIDAHYIRAVTPVRQITEGTIGLVAIRLNRSHIETQLRAARTPLIQVAAALLVVSIGLVAILLTLLFRPLKSIEEGLVRIGRGDLDTPLPVSRSLELGRLALTLNDMAAQLKTTRALARAREIEIVETQREVITTLGDVVESRSRETANHTRRVGAMSRELALLSGLTSNEASLLRLASPMHDVGKIGIPDAVLNKPGKLTDEEYKLMQTHAAIGYDILKGSSRPILKAAAVIARDHHERWDGTGYPHGVAGEDIHVFGRITALVDVFDAITSDRVYRKGMPLEKALGIIKEGRGTHFEPRLVDIFLANLNRFLAIREKYADPPVEAEVPAEPVTVGS